MHDFPRTRAARVIGSCWIWLYVGLTLSAPLAAQTEEAERVVRSTRVLAEIIDTHDAAIPGAVLETRRHCGVSIDAQGRSHLWRPPKARAAGRFRCF